MAELDRIIILNLERRPDKFHFVLGGLRTLFFPDIKGSMEQRDGCFIKRFIAHDWMDYKDMAKIVDAAVADGFPQLKSFADAILSKTEGHKKTGLFATLWSQAALLRHIVESKENVIFLLDNHTFAFRYPFPRVEAIIKIAYCLDPFRAMQLGYHYKECPHYQDGTFFGNGFLSGWDMAYYVVPEGAQFLLDLILNDNGKNDMIGIISSFVGNRQDSQQGLYHLLDPMITKGMTLGSDRKSHENYNF